MDTHAHLSTELLELVEAGEIPLGALLPVAVSGWPRWRRLRAWLLADARRRVRSGDLRGYVAVAAGLLAAAEVDPTGEARAAAVVAKLAELPAGERMERLRNLTKWGSGPALFDALLAEVRSKLDGAVDEAEGWLGLARVALVRLRASRVPRAVLWGRELLLFAHEANLLRLRGDSAGAAAAFAAVAGDAARREHAGLAIQAEVWEMAAQAEADLGRFAEASRLLVQAETSWRALAAPAPSLRAQVDRGEILLRSGDRERALSALHGVLHAAADLGGAAVASLVETARRLLAAAAPEDEPAPPAASPIAPGKAPGRKP